MGQNSNSFVRGKFSGTTLTCTSVQGVAQHFSAAWPPRGCLGRMCSACFPGAHSVRVSKYQTPGALPDL